VSFKALQLEQAERNNTALVETCSSLRSCLDLERLEAHISRLVIHAELENLQVHGTFANPPLHSPAVNQLPAPPQSKQPQRQLLFKYLLRVYLNRCR